MESRKGEKEPPAHLRRHPDQVFGIRSPLTTKMLPTVAEVGQALAYEAQEATQQKGVTRIKQEKASTKVSNQLEALYEKASIPTFATPREAKLWLDEPGRTGGRHMIRQKVRKLWNLRSSISKGT